MPGWILASRRSRMKAHRVRKRRAEQSVVAACDALKYCGEVFSLYLSHFFKRSEVPQRRQQNLEGPDRPKRNDSEERSVRSNEPVSITFRLDVVAQQTRTVLFTVIPLVAQFFGDLIGDQLSGPDLPMRMRVARAHHRTPVFKD